jgi:hypothetical protein
MKDVIERMECSPAERSAEASSRVRDAGGTKTIRKPEKSLQDIMVPDPVVNELMIRRIMAALMSAE